MKSKICTSIEQSKKLIELGIDVNTADMCWSIDIPDLPTLLAYPITDCDNWENKISAWSLSSLMNLLPSEFTEVGKYSTSIYEIHIRKYNLIEDVNLHQIAYGNYKFYEDGSSSWKDMINTGEKEDLLDAVFDMIVWLKENKKI